MIYKQKLKLQKLKPGEGAFTPPAVWNGLGLFYGFRACTVFCSYFIVQHISSNRNYRTQKPVKITNHTWLNIRYLHWLCCYLILFL